MSQTEVVDERDKPFILALIASAMFIIIMLVGGYGAYKHNTDMVEYAKWLAAPVVGFLSSAWALYFKNKA